MAKMASSEMENGNLFRGMSKLLLLIGMILKLDSISSKY